jgi:hypothetical protein
VPHTPASSSRGVALGDFVTTCLIVLVGDIDIIGDSVYSEHAELSIVEKQSGRISRGDRTDGCIGVLPMISVEELWSVIPGSIGGQVMVATRRDVRILSSNHIPSIYALGFQNSNGKRPIRDYSSHLSMSQP